MNKIKLWIETIKILIDHIPTAYAKAKNSPKLINSMPKISKNLPAPPTPEPVKKKTTRKKK